MTTKTKTHIAFIIDASGSMLSLRGEVIETVNNFIEQQRKLKTDDATFTLVTFNSTYSTVLDAVPLDEVKLLTEDDYRPSGGTALLDALGSTINSLILAKPEGRVLIAVMTDGHENMSREYTGKRVPTLVTQQQALDWEFVFLGADLPAYNLGIQANRIVPNMMKGRVGDVRMSGAVLNAAAISSRTRSLYDIGSYSTQSVADLDQLVANITETANTGEGDE